MLKRLREWWKAWLESGTYPDDPKERARIRAHMLGAGAAPKVEGGTVRVEVLDERKEAE